VEAIGSNNYNNNNSRNIVGSMPRHTRKKRIPLYPEIPHAKHTIKPGNDFYTFINGNWLRHVNMPPYLSSYSVSEEIEDGINKELLSIIYNARNTVRSTPDSSIPHTEYLLGTLTESIMNNSVQFNNVNFLYSLVSSLKCIRDRFDIGSTLGDFIKHRTPTVLNFQVSPLETNTKILRLTITPGKLGLPDISYYFTQGDTKTHIITAYANLLKLLGKDFDMIGLEQIIGLEKIIAESIQDSQYEEFLVKGKDLNQKYPNIPWESLFQNSLGWSLKKFESHDILITNPRYMRQLNKWMTTFTIESWKLLLGSQLILHMLPLLPPPYDDMDFNLFDHRMKDQTEKIPQHRLALHLTEQWLSASLGSEFIHKYVPKVIKHQALSISSEIRRAAAELVGSTEWLEESTRKKAFTKVNNIYLGVAYPTTIYKDKKTTLHPEHMLKNILTLAELDFQDEMNKINTSMRREIWDENVFAVNAYYYSEANRLVLPAGILRWPFFHQNASDGWNFGGLGCTIGHEISHAFDNDGKDYDEHGNRNTWWSKAEEKRYNKKTRQLINLFNKTSMYGHHINGFLTLSENIADLCGVSISLAALKKRLLNVSSEKRKQELCDFFISYAVSWRTKEKKEKVLQSLFMDVHSPPSARVNNIVCQFDEWYECFDVKPGDILYRDTTERIRIF
jgi:predicted metalloendopeptidase